MSFERYVELLSNSDYAILERIARSNPTFSKLGFDRIRKDPELWEYFLSSDDIYRALFESKDQPFLAASPFLSFSVLIHRSAVAITETSFVAEWIGPRRRVPLFDTKGAKKVLKDPTTRFFLAELLTSFTHVSSGTVVRRSSTGLKKKRFSELDLASLVDIASDAEETHKVEIVKRIGDLSLLLAGVFPDHAGTMVARSARYKGAVVKALSEVLNASYSARHPKAQMLLFDEEEGGLSLLDCVASASYWYVIRSNIGTTASKAGRPDVFERVASDSEAVRRALNFVTDRYLFKYRSSWFGHPN